MQYYDDYEQDDDTQYYDDDYEQDDDRDYND